VRNGSPGESKQTVEQNADLGRLMLVDGVHEGWCRSASQVRRIGKDQVLGAGIILRGKT
jgi:hypothetical protein